MSNKNSFLNKKNADSKAPADKSKDAATVVKPEIDSDKSKDMNVSKA